VEFTSARPAGETPSNPLEGISFSLDGVSFHCQGQIRLFEISDSARLARQGDQAAQASLFAESILMALGQEEFDRFRVHIRDHDTPDETIISIAEWINGQAEARAAGEAERPTRRPASSSSGPGDQDGRISRVISLQAATVEIQPQPVGQIVMEEDGQPLGKAVAAARKTAKGNGRRTA
jgi:hypothetical protein